MIGGEGFDDEHRCATGCAPVNSSSRVLVVSVIVVAILLPSIYAIATADAANVGGSGIKKNAFVEYWRASKTGVL